MNYDVFVILSAFFCHVERSSCHVERSRNILDWLRRALRGSSIPLCFTQNDNSIAIIHNYSSISPISSISPAS